MTKRLVELKVGDSDANHQAVSKSDITVNISNSVKADKYSPYPNLGEPSARNIENFAETAKIPASAETQPLAQTVPTPSAPFDSTLSSSVENNPRYIRAEVFNDNNVLEPEDNKLFLRKLAEIQQRILANDDRKLLINLLDQSGRIIIDIESFIDLIAALLSTETNIIPKSSISVQYFENVSNGCCGGKISPFVSVESIKINNQEFKYKNNIAYNLLQDRYKISVSQLYAGILAK